MLYDGTKDKSNMPIQDQGYDQKRPVLKIGLKKELTMEQKALSRWLKVIVIGVGVCGLVGLALIIPSIGKSIIEANPEYASWYMPWLIFACIFSVPCFTALFFGWKIAGNIGSNRSFSYDNARYLKWISWLAGGDSAFFFLGNIALWFMNMNHPGIVIGSLIITFIGVAITVAAAALSHLVKKAAALQEESDLTI